MSVERKARALDNGAIEEFWGTLKQDENYIMENNSITEARQQIRRLERSPVQRACMLHPMNKT